MLAHLAEISFGDNSEVEYRGAIVYGCYSSPSSTAPILVSAAFQDQQHLSAPWVRHAMQPCLLLAESEDGLIWLASTC